MDKPVGLIGGVAVFTTETMMGLLLCLIVIIDSDALLAELLDLLPCCSAQQAAFEVCHSIMTRRRTAAGVCARVSLGKGTKGTVSIF